MGMTGFDSANYRAVVPLPGMATVPDTHRCNLNCKLFCKIQDWSGHCVDEFQRFDPCPSHGLSSS